MTPEQIAAMPDVIWTYDANGNRRCGRPNFAKPGVAEQVQREAFENECAARPPTSNIGMIMRMQKIAEFERT